MELSKWEVQHLRCQSDVKWRDCDGADEYGG